MHGSRVMRAKLFLLPIALGLSGCFLFHGDEDVDDGLPGDAAPPPVDAGTIAGDGGPTDCRPVQAVAQACVEGDPAAFIEPGYLLLVEDCHCGGELRCDLIDYRAGEALATVEVSVCGERDCRACTGPTEVFCPLPAGGPHTIVRGPFAHFEMGEAPGDGLRCQSVGSLGGGLCSFPGSEWLPETAWGPSEVCLPGTDVVEGERVAITVSGFVPCSFEPGPCEAVLDDTTGEIALTPRLRNCDEGAPTWDCGGDTGLLTWTCWTPPLRGREGGYDVRLGDRSLFPLAVGGPAEGCIDLSGT